MKERRQSIYRKRKEKVIFENSGVSTNNKSSHESIVSSSTLYFTTKNYDKY